MNSQNITTASARRQAPGRRRHGGLALAVLLVLAGITRVEAQFTPGSGGSVPDIAPFTDPEGSIGGLWVYQSHRYPDIFGGGNDAVIELRFFPPAEFGADAYVLQRSINGTDGWEDVPWGGGVLRTPANNTDNFSFDPGGNYFYRLRVEGGTRAGQVSNVVAAAVSIIETRFAGWTVDSSMFVTGVMYPWVGHGMEATFDVRDLMDNDSPITGGIDLQWYRVHPRTREMTLIPGETNPVYATTNDDVGGWLLVCRATGNGTTVGGFINVQAGGGVKIQNKAFASNFTATGFRLNLYKSVPSLAVGDLQLTYYDDALMSNVPVPIQSVTPLGGNASFFIGTTLPAGIDEFSLSNVSDVWTMGEEREHHPGIPPMFMEFITISPQPEITEPEITVIDLPNKPLSNNRGQVIFRNGQTVAFAVRNDGSAPLVVRSAKTVVNPNEFRTTPLTRTLAPGASATFKVTFKDKTRTRRSSGKVQIQSNDPDERSFLINLLQR
jgi:hypothetical protein